MIHVRRHQRQTASGKTATVRAHERDTGDGTRPAPDWATPARASDLRESAGRPGPQAGIFADDDGPDDGDWWADDEVQPVAPVWPRGEAEPDSPALTRMKDEMRHWRALDVEIPPAVPDTSPLGRVLGTDTQEGADRFARLKAYREAGYDGPLDRDERIPDPDDPAEQQALSALAAMR